MEIRGQKVNGARHRIHCDSSCSEDFSAARALRQEFDYVGLHEDKSIDVENPDKNPTKIGFVKRKRKDNPDSTFQK